MKNLTQNLLTNNPSSFSSFTAVSTAVSPSSFKTEKVSKEILKQKKFQKKFKKILRNYFSESSCAFFKEFSYTSQGHPYIHQAL